MNAIIKTGGKQYNISEGQVFEIEKINGKKGDKIEIEDILAVFDDNKIKIGQPKIKGIKISAEIVDQIRLPKVRIVKHKAKKRYRRVLGHRQPKTKIKILKIQGV